MLATLLLPAGVTSLASIKYRDEDEIIEQKTNEGKTVDQAYIEDVKTLDFPNEKEQY